MYRYGGGSATDPCALMLQDAPVAAYVLRDWLLCRQKPLRALPAYLWRPPRSVSSSTRPLEVSTATNTVAVFSRALWPDVDGEYKSAVADEKFEAHDDDGDIGGDADGNAYGNENDDGDDDEDEELSNDGGGSHKKVMSRARRRALTQFVQWSAQAGHLLPALAALPPAKRFSAVEECSGLLGHGASDKGIQTTILNALFDLKVSTFFSILSLDDLTPSG